MKNLEFQMFVKEIEKKLKLCGGYSIGIVKNGEIDDIFCSGYSDINQRQAVNKNTKFPLSCLTKGLTALLAYDSLDVDIPLKEYCKMSFNNSYVTDNITLRDLLCHRSGIYPNTLWTYLMREKEVCETVDDLPRLKSESFRKKYIYSNYGFSLVSYVLECLYKKSYESILGVETLKKMGIEDFLFYEKDNSKNKRNIEAKPYFYDGEKYVDGETLNVHLLNSASGIILDIEEALKILLYLIRISNLKEYNNFFIPNILSDVGKLYKEVGYEKYALGLYHKEVYGYDVYYHNGYIVGYSSFIGFVPRLQSGIIVLCNNEKTVFPRIVAYKALEMHLGMNSSNWCNRLLREQRCGEYSRMAFIEEIQKSNNTIMSKVPCVVFNKYGLEGKVNFQKGYIEINSEKFPLSYLSENRVFTYIRDLNDYLIISLDNGMLSFGGTNILDLLQLL